MKRKLWVVIGIIVLAVSVIVLSFFLLRDSGGTASQDAVFTTQVSELMGLSQTQQGLQNRYAGVVEPQKTLEIQLENGRTVAELFVKEGDEVKEGDALFRYDTEELSMSLEQQKLELEKLDNSLESQRQKIAELEKEKANAPSDQQLQYTMEIQESSANLKQSEYERKVKAMEIEKTQKSIEQAIVTTTMAGVVRSIEENGATDEYGNPKSFMTILATGEYRVKGLVNEQNIYMIQEGTPVTVHSRVRDDLVWSGSIVEIDTENASQGNQNNYYYGGGMSDTSLQSSKYPFYIVLDSYEGLMLGQHVYIETGETAAAHTEGVWIYEGYLMQEEDGSYTVWAADGKKIEKQPVTLGEYDEMLGQYEIVEGLTQESYIAWPEEGIEAGAPIAIS